MGMCFRLTAAFALLASPLLLQAQDVSLVDHIFMVRDISPDPSNFEYNNPVSNPGGDFPAGRIKSLVVDPTDNKVIYAGAEFSGVWKSTTGATWVAAPNPHATDPSMKWFQASNGLRSGLTQNNVSLAIDGEHHQHLLYATNDDDGRPNKPLGGLWVSTDAAGHWVHVTLPSCSPPGIASVAFESGQPFVSTSCGIWTTSSSDLTSGWTLLPTGSNSPPNSSLVIGGGKKTLFACFGDQVYRATDLGTSGTWDVQTLSGACRNLAAAPNGGEASTAVLSIWSQPSNSEVSLVDFASSAITPLSFSSRPHQHTPTAVNGYGSGTFVIGAAQISNPLGKPAGPGATYDVYAADSCALYAYKATPKPAWTLMAYGTNDECSPAVTGIHVDTWAVAFPSWYDTTVGTCAVYAATDGGVFFTGSKTPPGPVTGGCTSDWRPVQRGLHVLASTTMFAITAGSKPFTSLLTKGVYLPTGDNEVWMTTFAGWKNWQNFGVLGDGGQAYVDPAFPDQVVVARWGTYIGFYSPPYSGGKSQNLGAGFNFDGGMGAGGVSNFVQIMTLKSGFPTPPSFADYLSVVNSDPSGCTGEDRVMRNGQSPPTPAAWFDISPSDPTDQFPSCTIAKLQAGGGHKPGSLNVYALTYSLSDIKYGSRTAGKIYRGVVDIPCPGCPGKINKWELASGSATSPLGTANNFFVNPYDPGELYSVDATKQEIKVSRDSGKNWNRDEKLTDLATNHGEYRIDCSGSTGTEAGSYNPPPFQNGCSLATMSFDVFIPKVRLACMIYGGLIFSRDNGHHWMALDVTDNNHFLSDNLTEMVSSCFFDGESHVSGSIKPPIPVPDQHIYAALKGKSLKLVIGPFLDLESLNFTYTFTDKDKHNVLVKILNPAFPETIQLRPSGNGAYRGSLLFDYKVSSTVSFQYIVDGTPQPIQNHVLSAQEISDGVAEE